MIKVYSTITAPVESVLKEKGSSFIAKLFPVNSVEEFQETLSAIKKQYYDATHHCYAVRLLNGYEKYSDDGEPGGTAGVRIMNAITSHNLHDVALVVIRYFGGTKLGVGPLGVAYAESAKAALQKVKIIEKQAYLPLELVADFDQTSAVYHLFSQFTVKSIDAAFANQVTYKFFLLYSEEDRFLSQLDDVFRGKYVLNTGGAVIYL
jgi:uncharacterized YigZ family protein